jgi:hypothetical protein|tara:strand:+ start:781 stop:1734 length:954 start_codon:yes stop_codon:yes gene_type:complete
MAVGHADFGEVASTTLNEHASMLANNIFENQPYMFFINQAGRVKDFAGGQQIVEPIIYAGNSTFSSYSGYDTLDVTAQTGITAATFAPKQAYASIAIDGYTQMVNAGPEEVIDLLEAKMMQTTETITEEMDQMLITSDGTGNSGKDWLGLAALVGDATVGPATVGGIVVADNAWWRSQVDDVGAGALVLSDMNTMVNNCSNGVDRPDLILTSQKQFEAFESLITPQQMFRDQSIANAGFRNLLYKDIPIVYDGNVADDDMYFLNSKYLKLRPNRRTWFTTTPFVRPHNQDAIYAQVLLGGQQTVNNRSRQGLMHNIG